MVGTEKVRRCGRIKLNQIIYLAKASLMRIFLLLAYFLMMTMAVQQYSVAALAGKILQYCALLRGYTFSDVLISAGPGESGHIPRGHTAAV